MHAASPAQPVQTDSLAPAAASAAEQLASSSKRARQGKPAAYGASGQLWGNATQLLQDMGGAASHSHLFAGLGQSQSPPAAGLQQGPQPAVSVLPHTVTALQPDSSAAADGPTFIPAARWISQLWLTGWIQIASVSRPGAHWVAEVHADAIQCRLLSTPARKSSSTVRIRACQGRHAACMISRCACTAVETDLQKCGRRLLCVPALTARMTLQVFWRTARLRVQAWPTRAGLLQGRVSAHLRGRQCPTAQTC